MNGVAIRNASQGNEKNKDTRQKETAQCGHCVLIRLLRFAKHNSGVQDECVISLVIVFVFFG